MRHSNIIRLQIISDLHLEFREGQIPYIKKVAPHIALLGDIGKPHSFAYSRLIANLAHRFQTVIIIAGNHEYFGGIAKKYTVYEIKTRIREIASRFPNVHFLDNSSLMLEGVRILGTTLWTHIPRHLMQIARKKVNDYRMIYLSRVQLDHSTIAAPLTPEVTSAWHDQSVAWLKNELTKDLITPTIVLTHHAPTGRNTSNPSFSNQDMRFCYHSDLDYLVLKPPVIAIGFGHTHWPSDQILSFDTTSEYLVRVVSNPLGYPHEELYFKPTVLEVSATSCVQS